MHAAGLLLRLASSVPHHAEAAPPGAHLRVHAAGGLVPLGHRLLLVATQGGEGNGARFLRCAQRAREGWRQAEVRCRPRVPGAVRQPEHFPVQPPQTSCLQRAFPPARPRRPDARTCSAQLRAACMRSYTNWCRRMSTNRLSLPYSTRQLPVAPAPPPSACAAAEGATIWGASGTSGRQLTKADSSSSSSMKAEGWGGGGGGAKVPLRVISNQQRASEGRRSTSEPHVGVQAPAAQLPLPPFSARPLLLAPASGAAAAARPPPPWDPPRGWSLPAPRRRRCSQPRWQSPDPWPAGGSEAPSVNTSGRVG